MTRSRAFRRSKPAPPTCHPNRVGMRVLRATTNTNATALISLLAGIDLVSGQVHALVRDRHRSREFIEFLKLIDAAYPPATAIKLILDNHSAHISRETTAWLAERPIHLPRGAPARVR